jgi:hypothetical protein
MHSHLARTDPGDCLICGAAHCSCGGDGLTVEQLPATAAARALATTPQAATVQATLPAGQFTTGTYRGTTKR